jgi:hypothetical protein
MRTVEWASSLPRRRSVGQTPWSAADALVGSRPKAGDPVAPTRPPRPS